MLRGLRSRLPAFAAASLVALLVTAGAANGRSGDAFNGSRLVVASTSVAGLSSTGAVVELGDPRSGAIATAARVDLSIPAGYGLDLQGRTGSTVGDFLAVAASPTDPSSVNLLQGSVVVADPAAYAADPTAQACAPGTHSAYWSASLESFLAGPGLTVPIAVDAGQDAAGGTTYTLHLCPFVAPSSTFPSGISLVTSFIDFARLSLPPSVGTYQWSAVVTPLTAGAADPAGAFELRGDAPLPQVLTLHARYDAKAHAAVVSGSLLAQGQPRAGVTVTISRPDADLPGEGITTTTRGDGSFAVEEAVTATAQFQAGVDTVSIPCATPSSAPGGCRDESIAGAQSRTAVVVLPRATDPKLAPKAHDQAIARKGLLAATDVPGSEAIGDAPPPCAAFIPRLHKLTETGDQRSQLLLTHGGGAELYSTASVFKTVADAHADLTGNAQVVAAFCEASNFADNFGGRVSTVRKLTLPAIGNEVRGYRATIVGDFSLTVDLLFVRTSRAVLTLHVISETNASGLEVSLLRTLVGRAR